MSMKKRKEHHLPFLFVLKCFVFATYPTEEAKDTEIGIRRRPAWLSGSHEQPVPAVARSNADTQGKKKTCSILLLSSAV